MASTSNAGVKRSRASAEQMRALLDVLGEDEGLASGKFKRLHGKLEHQKRWKEVAAKLNAMGGATKTVEQWYNAWRDLKARTSNKVRDLKNDRARTGNRPILEAPLTDVELRVVDLVGETYIEGAENCPESVPLEGGEEFFSYADEARAETPTVARATTSATATAATTATSATATAATSAPTTPKTPAQTLRRGLKRKREDVQEKFVKIAESQAESLRMLAEAQVRQVDLLEKIHSHQEKSDVVLANAIAVMGEGLRDCAKAFNRLSHAIANGN